MKKKPILLPVLFIFFLCLTLSGCGGAADSFSGMAGDVSLSIPASTPASIPDSHSDSSTTSGSSEYDVSLPQTSASEDTNTSSIPSSSTEEPQFLNVELLDSIDHPLSALGDGYGEDYYFHGVGSSTDALVYYNPYICFYINAIISGMDGAYPDPLTSEYAVIQSFALQSDYDPTANIITGQKSLRRLFLTEEPITYELLCTKLGQTPKLEYSSDGGYNFIREYELPEWQPLASGTYHTVFVFNSYSIRVSFIETDSGHMALSTSAALMT